MDEQSIKNYLTQLGCRKIKSNRNQVYSTCPNEFEHEKGKDTRPGFTVRIDPFGRSPSWCPSCHTRDSFEWIVFEKLGIKSVLSDSKSEFVNGTTNAKIWGTPLVSKQPTAWPEYLFESYATGVPKYALTRGLTLDTCRSWKLGHDRKNKRLLFSIRDRKGRLVGVSGRTLANSRAKYLTYVWDTKNDCLATRIDEDREIDFVSFRRNDHLYGANKIDYDTDVLVVEGEIDVLRTWQNGFNALGVKGSYLAKEQVDLLVSLCPKERKTVLLFDNDRAGELGAKHAKKVLEGRLPFQIVRTPKDVDPGDMDRDQLLEILNQ